MRPLSFTGTRKRACQRQVTPLHPTPIDLNQGIGNLQNLRLSIVRNIIYKQRTDILRTAGWVFHVDRVMRDIREIIAGEKQGKNDAG